MYFANARSIRNKSIAVELLLNAIDYDIVSFQFVETYLTSDDTSAKYLAGCGDVYDLLRVTGHLGLEGAWPFTGNAV